MQKGRVLPLPSCETIRLLLQFGVLPGICGLLRRFVVPELSRQPENERIHADDRENDDGIAQHADHLGNKGAGFEKFLREGQL